MLKSLALEYGLRTYFNFGNTQSARIAAALLHPNAEFAFTRYSENVAGLECEPPGLKERTKYLRDRYEDDIASLSPDELIAVKRSAEHFRMLYLSIINGSIFNFYAEMCCLIELGWRDDLLRFFKRLTERKAGGAHLSLGDLKAIRGLENEFIPLPDASRTTVSTSVEDQAPAPRQLLCGLQAISIHLGMTEGEARRLHEKKILPTFKVGSKICAGQRELDSWVMGHLGKQPGDRRNGG